MKKDNDTPTTFGVTETIFARSADGEIRFENQFILPGPIPSHISPGRLISRALIDALGRAIRDGWSFKCNLFVGGATNQDHVDLLWDRCKKALADLEVAHRTLDFRTQGAFDSWSSVSKSLAAVADEIFASTKGGAK